MTKIIEVESCRECDLSFDKKMELECPVRTALKQSLPTRIYKGCPLPDLKPKTVLEGLKNVPGENHEG